MLPNGLYHTVVVTYYCLEDLKMLCFLRENVKLKSNVMLIMWRELVSKWEYFTNCCYHVVSFDLFLM